MTIYRATKRTEILAELRKMNYFPRALPDIREFQIEASGENKIYYVMRIESIQFTCTCPDYRFRQRTCKHIKQINGGK